MTDKKKRFLPSCAACELPIPQRICITDKGKGKRMSDIDIQRYFKKGQ